MAMIAKTLDEALEALELEPLDFSGKAGVRPASDPSYYEAPPPRDDDEDGLAGPGPTERIRDQLLQKRQHEKVFLSGHVGSGKSTELNKLMADPALSGAFAVVPLRIEAGLVPFLDAPQLLFLIAGALFDFGAREGLLTGLGKWRSILTDVETRLLGQAGVTAKEGALSVEMNFLFVKIREDLKLSEHRRKQLRELGETQQTLLLDLIDHIALDIESSLVQKQHYRTLLLLVDDLDKVREPEQQKNIFNVNLGLLFAPKLRAVYTVPSGVVFGPNRAEVRRSLEHLYPIRVLDKAPSSFDPERAFIPGSDKFFRRAVDKRVIPSLIEDGAVRLAVIYSGGVLREFFRLLRSALGIARRNGLDVVDERALRATVRDERRRDTIGLYATDYQALRAIHTTHEMASDAERRYLDEARVLECYNDKTWYEVNPLLWKVIQEDT